jgi:metal-sulfur cluster biosynthetic enzyme
MITKEQVYEALLDCYDPEIPVNIVDLGLIYDVEVDGEKVAVKMTLTAPGCGMGTMIAADAKEKIMALDGITDATVDLVWDPPWNPSMIKDEAKQKLGIV